MTVFSDSPALRGYWYAIANSDDITSDAEARELLGQRLVVWRDPSGTVLVAPDRCPHREAPLSAGTVTDGVLTCIYHGWAFGDAGRCVDIPSSAEGVPIPPAAHLPCVKSQERYGLVWACLGDPVADIPAFPYEDDPTYRRINNPHEEWACSATRMTDNFMDVSHFPWVHVGTFGRAQDTTVPPIDLVDLDDEFHGYAYEVDVNNTDPDGAKTSGLDAEVLTRQMSSGFNLPFNVRSTIRYETGLDHILLLLSTPIDDVRSYFTFVVWRNDDFSVPAEEIVAFDRAIGAEDKAMLEQLDGVLPLSRTGVVSVQADKPSLEWRRRFAELIEC